MQKMLFVNLPVRDLQRATRFYEAIGCTKNAAFSDETASSMAWSETIVFQLLVHQKFASFTPKPISNAQETCEVLLALTCESREAVDALVQSAGATGGHPDVREPMDMGWMYNRAFADPDGHTFEVLWMDMTAIPES